MSRSMIIPLIILSISLMMGSCVSKKRLTYLQFSGKSDRFEIKNENVPTVTPSSYKVMPYDNLFIRVITPDPQWSSLFNVMPVGAGGSVTEESAGLFGYMVDSEGNIEIPFVGKVEVIGKTLSDIKVDLDSIFKNYVTDASITIRLVNNYVSILGEVNHPGRYPLTKDRVNILEAISLAGDISVYGNRNKLQLIRPSRYGPIVKEFSLADRSILSSELYYIMPNDIIYTPPGKGRPFQVNTSVYSLILTGITTVLVLVEYFR